MVLMDALGALGGYLAKRYDDDYIDRLHYFITSNICIAMSVLISYKQFGGKPIECIMGNQLASSYEEYAENFCWSQKTFHVPFSDAGVDTDKEVRYKNTISYYQWVPFFLLFEAACFRLPSVLWQYVAGHSGINVHDIVKAAMNPGNIDHDTRKQSLMSLSTHLQNALRFHRRLFKRQVQPHKWFKFMNLPYTAFFVTFVYLLTKVLYMINVTLQLYCLNIFLQTENETNSMYGFHAIKKILTGDEWDNTGLFPRVTLCDFMVRATGSNVQHYTVQCVLVINIFNEKIFVFLWFWYLLLMVLTAISTLYWAVIMLFPCFSRWFISRHLELSEMPFDPQGSEKDVERFVVGYLKVDGVFIIRMINSHAGIIFGTDLVLSLWRSFYGIEESYRRSKSTELTPSVKSADILPTAPGKEDNKLNFVRLRNNRKSPSQDRSGTVTKALEEKLIPQTTALNAAIMAPPDNNLSDENDDIDAENRSDDVENHSDDASSPSETSANFHATPTLARGKSLDTARLIEEGKRGTRNSTVSPKTQSVKKTVV